MSALDALRELVPPTAEGERAFDAVVAEVETLRAALQRIVDVEPARAGTVASEIARNALAAARDPGDETDAA